MPNRCLLAAFALALVSQTAGAQTACPEGRMKDGTCVDPRLAAASRQNGILMNQPKISETALPVPPTHNRAIPRASEFNKFELGQGGNFSTNPFPPSP